MSLNQDARVYAGLLDGEESATHQLEDGRAAWVHVARGSVELNGTLLSAGDGAGIDKPGLLEFSGASESEVLLFDLAA